MRVNCSTDRWKNLGRIRPSSVYADSRLQLARGQAEIDAACAVDVPRQERVRPAGEIRVTLTRVISRVLTQVQ